jgi:hypothetical protein
MAAPSGLMGGTPGTSAPMTKAPPDLSPPVMVVPLSTSPIVDLGLGDRPGPNGLNGSTPGVPMSARPALPLWVLPVAAVGGAALLAAFLTRRR